MKRDGSLRKVVALFKKSRGRSWYFSDICEATGLGLKDVVRVCQVLLDRGRIRLSLVPAGRRAR